MGRLNQYMRILLFLMLTVPVGCEMKKSAEVTYMETNATLVDSIRTLYLANDEDIAALDNASTEKVISSIRNLNYQIDQVKNALIDGSDQAVDKRAVKKYLADGKVLSSLYNLALACKDMTQGHDYTISVQPSVDPDKPSNDPISTHFDGMPLYEVVPILNGWILENERAIAHLISQ